MLVFVRFMVVCFQFCKKSYQSSVEYGVKGCFQHKVCQALHGAHCLEKFIKLCVPLRRDNNFMGILLAVLCLFPVALFGGWNFKDQSATFQFKGANASLYLTQPVNSFGGTIKLTGGCPDAFMTVEESSDAVCFLSGAITTASGTATLLGGELAVDGLALFLTGSTVLAATETVSYPVVVFGQGNKILGSPVFDYTITLTDASVTLDMGISTPLGKSVILNGGQFTLSKDLLLLDGALLLGSGYVDLGGYVLTLPLSESCWDTTLSFSNSSNIEIQSTTCLEGSWMFSGDGKVSTIRGHRTSGATLALDEGGSIIVGPNHQLCLSGLYIAGLGGVGGSFSIDSTATITFENCVLDLMGTWTVASGTLLVQHDTCRLVTSGMDSLVLTGSATRFIVDGVALQYDSLNNPGRVPIKTLAGATLVTLNKGDIISGTALASASQLEMVGGIDEDCEIFLNTNLEVNKYKMVKVKNPTPTIRTGVSLNGNGNKLIFSVGSVATLQIDPNIDLVIKNAVIEGFDPDKIFLYGFENSVGSVTFAENVTLLLAKDLVFSSTTNPLLVRDVVTLDGQGYSLTLTSSAKLLVQEDSQLTIKNCKVTLADFAALALPTNQATLNFCNASIFVPGITTHFDTGNLKIVGKTSISALVGVGDVGNANFVFSSRGKLCVTSASTMIIDKGLSFICEPDVSGDVTLVDAKKHLYLEDNTACLKISSSTLDVRPQGIIFDIGNVDIAGFSQIKVLATLGAELDIYSTVEVNVAANASLQVDGPIRYL